MRDAGKRTGVKGLIAALALLAWAGQAESYPKLGAPRAGDYDLVISAPEVLSAVEAEGGDFVTQLGVAPGPAPWSRRTEPALASLVQAIRDAVAKDRLDAQRGGFVNAHAVFFDPALMTANGSAMRLVGIVSRPDMRVSKPGVCGELRLIYRLIEAPHGGVASALPMTVMLRYPVLPAHGSDCAAETRASLLPASSSPGAVASQLFSSGSAVRPILRGNQRFTALEVNLQISKWPATLANDVLDQAHYWLAAFSQPGGRGALVPVRLENTPDAGRILADPALAERLAAWLTSPASLGAIDRGDFLLPDEFLATTAVSVSPFGSDRLANRPWTRLFSASQPLAGIDLSKFSRASTPAALLRRLDTLTCAGCHQSRSVAGFHWLGASTDTDRAAGNALALPYSTHVARTFVWRRGVTDEALRAAAKGRKLVLSDAAQAVPPPDRVFLSAGDEGAPCGLGDAGFAAWRCDKGLVCRAGFPQLSGAPKDVGQCLPAALGAIGDHCDPASVATAPAP